MKTVLIFGLPILISCSSPRSQPTPKPAQKNEATRSAASASQSPISGSSIADFNFTQVKVIFQPPPPPYPETAKQKRVAGTVVVEIVVNPNGDVQTAKALSGPQELYEYAENWAIRWKFSPAMLDGVAQYARFKLTMPFRLK
jgi:protein TonB